LTAKKPRAPGGAAKRRPDHDARYIYMRRFPQKRVINLCCGFLAAEWRQRFENLLRAHADAESFLGASNRRS
jgi:hypothetical protein